DGSRKLYGDSASGGRRIEVRFADRRVASDIACNPRLAVGEAYMNGQLVIENGDILDFLDFFADNVRWERGGTGRKAITGRGDGPLALLGRVNWKTRAKRNVAHHYELSDRLYDLFLDR